MSTTPHKFGLPQLRRRVVFVYFPVHFCFPLRLYLGVGRLLELCEDLGGVSSHPLTAAIVLARTLPSTGEAIDAVSVFTYYSLDGPVNGDLETRWMMTKQQAGRDGRHVSAELRRNMRSLCL